MKHEMRLHPEPFNLIKKELKQLKCVYMMKKENK